MGEIADDLIDRMMEDGYFPGRAFMPRGGNRPHYVPANKKKKKPAPAGVFDEQTCAAEFPGKKTDPSLLRDYPEKTFDMGFFPAMPKQDSAPDPWALNDGEEAPF